MTCDPGVSPAHGAQAATCEVVMSRTDVHRPFWVMCNDPFIRHWFTDRHYHEDGICDLAERLADRSYGHWQRGCHRWFSGAASRTCGCQMCTEQFHRKQQYRRMRTSWRRDRQLLLKMPLDEIDDGPVGWVPRTTSRLPW